MELAPLVLSLCVCLFDLPTTSRFLLSAHRVSSPTPLHPGLVPFYAHGPAYRSFSAYIIYSITIEIFVMATIVQTGVIAQENYDSDYYK